MTFYTLLNLRDEIWILKWILFYFVWDGEDHVYNGGHSTLFVEFKCLVEYLGKKKGKKNSDMDASKLPC